MSTERDCEDQSSDWSLGDSTRGYDVPKSVREGGATGPALKKSLGENGTAYESHSVNFECTECGSIRRFATTSFMTMYRCDECFMAIREAGRYDVERDREVFHP